MLTSEPAQVPHRAFMALDDVDERTAFFVRFLDLLHDLGGVRASHRRSFELLGLREGFYLLDVGCGPGSYARDGVPLVGPTGRVVGLDLSAAMIDVARRRTEGLDAPIAFQVGDACALPFPAATFDGCHIERVLQYLDDPSLALAEMLRVTRPGGRIVASEVDWDTFVCDVPGLERSVWRRAIAAMSDGAGNGWMGREVRRHVLDIGLDDVTSEGHAVIISDAMTTLDALLLRSLLESARDASAINEDECTHCIAGLEAAGHAGRFFFAMTVFTVSGRIPTGH